MAHTAGRATSASAAEPLNCFQLELIHARASLQTQLEVRESQIELFKSDFEARPVHFLGKFHGGTKLDEEGLF